MKKRCRQVHDVHPLAAPSTNLGANHQGTKQASIGHNLRLRVEYRPIDDLKLNPRNPRVHKRTQRRQLARSIKQFGFIVPILIDDEGNVLAGHGRIYGAQEAGLTEIPTICVDHLTDAEKRAYMIADNRLTEVSVWDDRLLAEHFKELSALNLDFDLDITGFSLPEIDLRILDLDGPAPGGDDAADILPSPSVSVTSAGDSWILGDHKVVCADARDSGVSKQLFGRLRAAMVLTDPPFNVRIGGNVSGLGATKHREFLVASGEMSESEFEDFLETICRRAAAVAADGALIFMFIDWRHVGTLLTAGNSVFSELKNICIWVKDNAGMGSLYRSQHEMIVVFKHGKGRHRNNVELGKNGRNRTNIWNYPGINTLRRQSEEGDLLALHPTVKNTAMLADAILDVTARGDIVFDPFLGSGSTLIAAERTRRRCYGIEIDPLYVDTIIRRWQAYTGGIARHAVTGKSFAETEAEVTDM